MVKVCARGPARAARGGRDSGARAASPTRSPASMLASSAGCARRTSPNNSPPPPRSTPPSRRSSPSMSSVARWTRSTTSATCPSSRTSITYVARPTARAFPRAAGLRRDCDPGTPTRRVWTRRRKRTADEGPTRRARARPIPERGSLARARTRLASAVISVPPPPARRGHRDAACPPRPRATLPPPLPFLRPVAAARRLAMTRHMPPVREPSRMGLRRLAFFSSFVRSLVRPSRPLTLLDPPSPPPVSFDRRANPR